MVKKAIAAFFTVLALSSVLTACNTTRGVGQDISEGGSAISGAATKAQQWTIAVRPLVVPFFLTLVTSCIIPVKYHLPYGTTCKRFTSGDGPIKGAICPG